MDNVMMMGKVMDRFIEKLERPKPKLTVLDDGHYQLDVCGQKLKATRYDLDEIRFLIGLELDDNQPKKEGE